MSHFRRYDMTGAPKGVGESVLRSSPLPREQFIQKAEGLLVGRKVKIAQFFAAESAFTQGKYSDENAPSQVIKEVLGRIFDQSQDSKSVYGQAYQAIIQKLSDEPKVATTVESAMRGVELGKKSPSKKAGLNEFKAAVQQRIDAFHKWFETTKVGKGLQAIIRTLSNMVNKATTFLGIKKAIKEAQEKAEEAVQQEPAEVKQETQKLFDDLSHLEEQHQTKPEHEVMQELRNKGISESDARNIAHGYANGWKEYVEEKQLAGKTYFFQKHGIKGLKIYKHPRTGKMVADFAGKVLGQGSYKRAKLVFRLDDKGTIQERVRLTSAIASVEAGKAESKPAFEEDIKKEVGVRTRLFQAGQEKDVPNLLAIIPIQYVNKKNELVTRYDTEFCHELQHLYKDKNNPTAASEALRYCRDALSCLAEMHKRGFVHKDIKLDNIFYADGVGLLADLGACAKMPNERGEDGDPYVAMGTPGYTAPEIILGATQNLLAMDMFSFGVMLLAFSRRDLHEDLLQKQSDMANGLNAIKNKINKFQEEKQKLENETKAPVDASDVKKKAAYDRKIKRISEIATKLVPDAMKNFDNKVAEYKKMIAKIQASLKGEGTPTKNPLDDLIADLLSFDPGLRPTSEEAKNRLEKCIKT